MGLEVGQQLTERKGEHSENETGDRDAEEEKIVEQRPRVWLAG